MVVPGRWESYHIFFFAKVEHLAKEKYFEVVHVYIKGSHRATLVRSNAFNNDKVLMPL